MKDVNFDKLYADFKGLFDICRYTDQDLKKEIFERVLEQQVNSGDFNFRFRLVIFKFLIDSNSITYIGYEK